MGNKVVRNIKNVTLVLLLVKVIGFVKQAVIANYFGASSQTDIFLLVSELVENLGEVLFSSITITFVTIYINVLENEGRNARDRLTANTLSYGIPITMLLAIVTFVFSDNLSHIIAPGYAEAELNIVSKYLKILAVAVVMMFITSVFRAILDAEKIFLPSKFEGIIKSVIIIGVCVVLGDGKGVIVLVYAILIYYIIAGLYLFYNIRKKTDVRFYVDYKKNKYVKQMLIYSVPLLISNGSVYLQNIVDKAIGSGLGEGAISYISYSGYLINSLHSLVIGSICTVLFSYFSTYVAEKNIIQLKNTLTKTVRVITLVTFYIITMVLIASKDIIKVVYGRGAFENSDVNTTANILVIYAIGLFFIGIRDILVRTHYAYQDTLATMINGIIGTVCNIALSIVMARYIGVYGIVLGTVFSYVIVMLLSFFTIRKHITFIRESKLMKLIIQLALICTMTVVVGLLVNRYVAGNHIIVKLILECGVSTVVFATMLFGCKNKEILEIKDMVSKKIRK